MPLYQNDIPVDRDDEEYVLPNLPRETHFTHLTDDIYFSNWDLRGGANSVVSSKKLPVVVERSISGIYDLAGDNGGTYALSSEAPIVEDERNVSTPKKYFSLISKYKVLILLGIVILGMWAIIIYGLKNRIPPQHFKETNVSTIRTPGKIILRTYEYKNIIKILLSYIILKSKYVKITQIMFFIS